jgi:pimeloyl-ACP methyl ester carboxylesterase
VRHPLGDADAALASQLDDTGVVHRPAAEGADDLELAWRHGAAANRYIREDGQDRKGVANYDFTTNLAAYTTPVLLIAGSRSEVLGESLQREQVLRYPSASLRVVDGAGHDVAWIKTAEVLTQIRAYLDARRGRNR